MIIVSLSNKSNNLLLYSLINVHYIQSCQGVRFGPVTQLLQLTIVTH